MKIKSNRFFLHRMGLGILALVLIILSCSSNKQIDFSSQIKPIFNKKCISCHGGVKKQGGFSVLFEEEAFQKLKSGAFGIVPGQPGQSEMIRRVLLNDPEERMPYEHEPLESEEIKILKQWIKQGAKWGEHWAYQIVEKQELPEIAVSEGSNNIDKFILEKIKKKDLEPSEHANPYDLVRRLGLDLIGFPIQNDITEVFILEPTLSNYERVVDSLLSSPHFGEKWASMWLDLARYADTKGYEKDNTRSIWPYRDWVIKALNDDKPYDQFITEQIAGDLLNKPSDDQLIATAFHRNTMTNDEGGTDNEEFRVAAAIDRTNTTWEAILGTSFACVQCHSHPYDPFKHKEYYEFNAFFNNTRDNDLRGDVPLMKIFKGEDIAKLKKFQSQFEQILSEKEVEEISDFIKMTSPVNYFALADDRHESFVTEGSDLAMRNHSYATLRNIDLTDKSRLLIHYSTKMVGGNFKLRLGGPEGKVIFSKTSTAADEALNNTIREFELNGSYRGIHDLYLSYDYPDHFEKGDDAELLHIYLKWFKFIKTYDRISPSGKLMDNQIVSELIKKKTHTVPVILENPKHQKRTNHVFERGNWTIHGDSVEPDVPESLNPWPEGAPRNRLGLSQWITETANPLTSRTIVNQIWEQIFGRGIVLTLEDLGTQGENPTHRELLDFLSYELMHNWDWSLKRLIKEVVMSSTYRQTTIASDESLVKDPDNLYLSRMSRNRLTAEQIRDQALYVSGMLNTEMYGPPVMPYQPDGIWASPYSGEKWVESKGDQKYRRAIYTFWKRGAPYPSMESFDAESRDVCSSRRISTNTPLQALVMMNDSVYLDLSGKLSNKLYEEDKGKDELIEEVYNTICGKPITTKKKEILIEFYNEATQKFRQNPELNQTFASIEGDDRVEYAALVLLTNSLFNLDEVLTKN